MSCDNCYSKLISGVDPSKEKIINTIDEAYNLGCIHVNHTGGNPTLRNDLRQIVEEVNKRCPNIMQTIVVNGTLLTEKNVKEFYKAGTSMFQISLDSLKDHDKLRKRDGLFQHIVDIIDYIVSKNLGIVCVSTTVTHKLIEDGLPDFIEWVNSKWNGKVFVLLNLMAEVGGKHGNSTVMLNRNEINIVKNCLKKFPTARIDYMFNFTGKSECPAAIREKIYIAANGLVFCCDLVHDKSFGNIHNENLKTIWKRMLKSDFYQERTSFCQRYKKYENN